MDEDLLTLMDKLGNEGTYDQVLNLDHSNVQHHRQTLKSRLGTSSSDYTEREIVGVSILLQHYSLESFTDRELKSLLNLDLSSLEHHTDVEYEPVMSNRLKGAMDTGSLRVYSIMNGKGGIDLSRINYRVAKSYTAYQFFQSYLNINNTCLICSNY
jgi:hypothetical protein